MASPTVRQHKGGVGTSTGTVAIAFTDPALAGSLLVYCMAFDKQAALNFSISSDVGGATGWSVPVAVRGPSISLYVAFKTATGGETTITGVASGSVTDPPSTAWVSELQQAGTAAWAEVATRAVNASNDASIATVSTGATGVASYDGLGIAAVAIDSISNAAGGSWSNGYVAQHNATSSNGSTGGIYIATKNVAAGSSTSSTHSTTIADQKSAALLVFGRTEAAGSGPTAPTVSAGVDASGTVGTAFTRTATETDNGASITTRAWTVLSGPTGVGSTIGTAAALSWTPSTVGTYVLRYAATNSAGTGTDDVTVTVAAAGGTAGTVTSTWLGMTAIQARVADGTGSVRAAWSTSATMSSPTYTPSVTPDSLGNVRLPHPAALAVDTPYWYQIERAATLIGPVESTRSLPSVGSFSFGFGSCREHTGDSAIMADILTRQCDLFIQHGDIHYRDINSTDPSLYRAGFDELFTRTNLGAVLRRVPNAYVWSDHDFCGNDSDGNATGRATVQQVYRERVPYVGLPSATGGIYQTFTVGRVRFVVLDTRSFRSPVAAVDNSSKVMLGAEQETWLQNLLAAADTALTFLVSAEGWIGASSDEWGHYTTERARIASYITASDTQCIMLCGDAHMLAIDDGTNSAAGVPVWHAAALNRSGSVKGGPYSGGTLAGTNQYGYVEVVDTGQQITATYRGIKADTTVWNTHSVSVAAPSDSMVVRGARATTRAASLTLTQTGPPPSSTGPNTITGLFAWYKPDAGVTVTGGAVSEWADQSGQGNHLTQATASRRPTHGVTVINSVPVLGFSSGAASQLARTATTVGISAAPFTVFAVFRRASTAADTLVNIGAGNGGRQFRTFQSKLHIVRTNQAVLPSGATVLPINTNCIGVARYTAGNNLDFLLNGASDGSAAAGTNNFAEGPLSVGTRPQGDEGWNGAIAEVIAYNRALTTAEIATVDSYLSDKYAITVADYVPSGPSGPTVRGVRTGTRAGRTLLAQRTAPTVTTSRATGRVGTAAIRQRSPVAAAAVRAPSRVDRPQLGHPTVLTATTPRASVRVGAVPVAQVSPVTAATVRASARVSRPTLTQTFSVAASAVRVGTRVAAVPLAHASTLTAGSVRAGTRTSTVAATQTLPLTVTAARAPARVGAPRLKLNGFLPVHDVRSAGRVGVPSLGHRSALVVVGVRASAQVSAPNLAPRFTLAVAGVRADARVLPAALAQTHLVVVAQVRAATRAGAPTVGMSGTLRLYPTRAGTRATWPALTQRTTTAIRPAWATPRVGTVRLTQTHDVTVAGVRTPTRVGTARLTEAQPLTVRGLRAPTRASRPTVLGPGTVTTLPVRTGARAGRLILGQRCAVTVTAVRASPHISRPAVVLVFVVTVQPVRAPTRAGVVVVDQVSLLTVAAPRGPTRAGRILMPGGYLPQPPPERTFTVAAEWRLFVVPQESRTLTA